MDGLLIGGGDRSRGETGQRGVSLMSEVRDSFWGTGAFIVESDEAGWRVGIEAADSALCWAAAEGGFVLVLAERDGLTSWVLFFLDRPGPVADRAELPVLSDGRFGDDSRDGLGEFAAEGVRFGSSFFVGGIEDVEVSRAGFEMFGAAVCSLAGDAVMSTGSVVSWVVPAIGVKDLSSMMVAVWLKLRRSRKASQLSRAATHANQSRELPGPCLGVHLPGDGRNEGDSAWVTE